MRFLHQIMDQELGINHLDQTAVPHYITANLKQDFNQRSYQQEAFRRFILFFNEDFNGKPSPPYHLMYNMATGSGKTLIMAGLILFLYEKGYRNFLFFVHSNNIINKTKENFLNTDASKYLFQNPIYLQGRRIFIKEVNTFESTDPDNIHIKFTTIQQLHLDLTQTKENNLTYEDLRDKKIVLIADEAHHFSSATRNQSYTAGSWEGTVLKILHQHAQNILLEFTATLEYESAEIAGKYQDKILFKYDLAQFRKDKYSKEIHLLRSRFADQERILQALILNIYRQELAARHQINLKPVILFKAKKTIRESEQNKLRFHQLISFLSSGMIEDLRKSAQIPVIQKAFEFFDRNFIDSRELVKRIQFHFKEENCLSANNDLEAEANQIILNTLEDENNPVRAIFAVQKLNEGWDVLNLFDIVRLYERDEIKSGLSIKTTLSEAQLIGRGARYFPFTINENQQAFTRKYDKDVNNELKILEELYYHTREDSRYISELKKALLHAGLYEEKKYQVTRHVRLTPEFRKSDFFKTGKIVLNKRVQVKLSSKTIFLSLQENKNPVEYDLNIDTSQVTGLTIQMKENSFKEKSNCKIMEVAHIPRPILRYALSENPFFHFDKLLILFPNLRSLSAFTENNTGFGQQKIIFRGSAKQLRNISAQDQLGAVRKFLQVIEQFIRSASEDYTGSNFFAKDVHTILTDKELRIPASSEKINTQEIIIRAKSWYAQNAIYVNTEEKQFVESFNRNFDKLHKNFSDIYLVRNESMVKITDSAGRTLSPSFLLFCRTKKNPSVWHQVFIDPKDRVEENNNWKKIFSDQLNEQKPSVKIGEKNYIATAMIYNPETNDHEFIETFKNTIKL